MDVCCLWAEAGVKDDERWEWVHWKYGKDHQICGMVDGRSVCISHTFHAPKAVHLPVAQSPSCLDCIRHPWNLKACVASDTYNCEIFCTYVFQYPPTIPEK